jgi:hypothetical protein
LTSKTSVPYTLVGYCAGAGTCVPYGMYPVVKLSPRSRMSNSYCWATWTAKRANPTEPVEPRWGFIPAIPATRKYEVVRSNKGLRARADIVEAALISKKSKQSE